MTASRPYFLLSNDDGIYARGLQVLIEELRPYADLLVMAPDGPRSGFGMAFTVATPISARLVCREDGLTSYACSGTPVDCIKLALAQYCTRRPDLIISGINHGDNSSVNSHYSGTMGAAQEGVLQGFPSIAFSTLSHDPDADFEPLRPYLADLAMRTLKAQLPPLTCLNVNFPVADSYKGVRVARMANSRWEKEIEPCHVPRGGSEFYWITGECRELEPEATDTDRAALAAGYVAITPTTLDNTAYGLLRALNSPDSPFYSDK